MTRDIRIRSWSGALVLALAGSVAPWARAQSFCSSDRQVQPVRLVERFINADCESCWADASAAAEPDELALDWIVPGAKGEDAPLSAAATREALDRLESLNFAVPAASAAVRRRVEAPKRGLRVSHGLPFNDYIGTSIELKSPGSEHWSAWLLLVETIPAGADGTPIERNLVRNALQLSWQAAAAASAQRLTRLFESRPMSIPAGARPERLRVVGWVQDGRGRIRAITQSRCAPPAPGG
jgi:hypothetical protein